MITTSKVRQYDTREGFELVDFAEVGLPVFRLTVEAVTLQRAAMSAINEFTLRAIQIGEQNDAGISRLLGLSDLTVRDSLDTLAYDELVSRVGDDDTLAGGNYAVTEIGKELLLQGTRVHREETLVFDYDGLRRRPINLGKESLVRASELEDLPAFQIRPYPADAPEIGEINLNEVAPAVRRLSDRRFERTLLAIRRIIRRQMLFRVATGLVFRGIDTGEYQIAFAIGDTLSHEHEMIFARNGGVKRPGLIRARSAIEVAATMARCLGPTLWGTMADRQVVTEVQRDVAVALDEYTVLRSRFSRKKTRVEIEGLPLPDPVRAEQRLVELRHKLDGLGLRHAASYELPELLLESLDKAERRLLITSTTVDGQNASRSILKRITDRLTEGVNVRIETSTELEAKPSGKLGSFQPAVQLWLEAQQRPNLTLTSRHQLDDELFFLVKDDDLAVVSDRPFLSHSRLKCFSPCVSLVSRRPEQVRQIAQIAGLSEVSPVFLRKKS